MDTTTLAQERYVSITTFKRDGTPVSTPVWVAGENGTLSCGAPPAPGR